MAQVTFGSSRGPTSQVSSKRVRSIFSDSDDDADDITNENIVKRQKITSSKLKLNYPEDEARRAMRGELMSTPSLKYLLDELVEEIAKCKQEERRSLCNNRFHQTTKGALKNVQESLVSLKRYLQAEAFIRMDNWTKNPLREWFDLVHQHNLEREFRNSYWEENQRVYAIQIAKLASHVTSPKVGRGRELSLQLSDQYGKDAKDIVARSVFVSGPGHPIVRSAVAIMVLAEQASPEHSVKRQENTARTTQIWAAWCIAKQQDNDREKKFLAATIVNRMHKNEAIKACFLHIHDELRRWSKEINEEEFTRWQRMHWRCHVITTGEIQSRPRALHSGHDNGSSKSTIKSRRDTDNTPNSETKDVKLYKMRRSTQPTHPKSVLAIKHLQASNLSSEKVNQTEEHQVSASRKVSEGPAQRQAQVQELPQPLQAQKIEQPQQLQQVLTSPASLMPSITKPSPPQGIAPTDLDNMIALLKNLRNASDNDVQAKKKETQGVQLYEEFSDKLRRELEGNLELINHKVESCETLMRNAQELTQELRDMAAFVKQQHESFEKKQESLNMITKQKHQAQEDRIKSQDSMIRNLRQEINALRERLNQLPIQQGGSDHKDQDSIVCAPTIQTTRIKTDPYEKTPRKADKSRGRK
ncbi:uncharacterized protein CTRU02_208944 [Colletotrichum truncatum]|uniref:Uncharacterized protein n=1 Tax=Colletotrichum truncatum TaxID=5467 RepID=A0ACC3YXV3_COLTU|nr:uncharacterized protein CTRU02_07865 [Colletotrichum truncatum]KAF6790959.1 hypothetical protein CTRU02_07865 [Colletotrichum truncatum]